MDIEKVCAALAISERGGRDLHHRDDGKWNGVRVNF